MFSGLSKKDKRLSYMIMYLITVTVLIYAINIVQYEGELGEKLGMATATVSTIFGIMVYNYKLFASMIYFCISGVSSWLIAGNLDGQVTLLFGLIGLVAVMFRATHGTMGTMMYFEKSPVKRLEMMCYNDYDLYKTEILHKLIILTIMVTLVVNVSKDPSITTEAFGIASNSLMIALLACLPLFTAAVGCMGVEDMYPVYFGAYAIECVVLIQNYLLNTETLVPMYMATERFILMFTLLYSYWFGNRQREVEV